MTSGKLSFLNVYHETSFVDNIQVPTADLLRYLVENNVSHVIYDTILAQEDTLIKILTAPGIKSVYVWARPIRTQEYSNASIRSVSCESLYDIVRGSPAEIDVSAGVAYLEGLVGFLLDPDSPLFINKVTLK